MGVCGWVGGREGGGREGGRGEGGSTGSTGLGVVIKLNLSHIR